MAEAKGNSATAEKPKEKSSSNGDDEFRDEQARAAKAQGQLGDNAVPEQRPQAFQRTDTVTGPVTQALQEQGVNTAGKKDDEPMGKDAYDAAEEGSGSGSSKERHEGLKVGDAVRVTDKHPVKAHRGRKAAVTRVVSFDSEKDEALKNAGTPESRFVQPKEVELSFRGGDVEESNVVFPTEHLEKIPVAELRANG